MLRTSARQANRVIATRRILVSGKVQGVFYRGWTEMTARTLGLSGWVRNLRSGDVEILASGPDEKVEQLVRLCHQGPPAAEVQTVRVEEVEGQPEPGFAIGATA